MFGTKKVLLLLMAVLAMAGSIDAAVPERQLQTKKDAAAPPMEEETMDSGKGASKSSKSTKKGAMTPVAPPVAPPVADEHKPTDAPKTTDAPKATDAPGHPTEAPKKGSKKGSKKHSSSDSGKGGAYDSGKGKGGKGKGGGSQKDSKKGTKKSGGGGDGSGGDPHAPTASPNAAPTNATAVPTSMDSFAVRPAPYAIYYTLENDSVADATIDQFNELAEITRSFLEGFFNDKYEQTSIIILDDFLTFLTRSDATARPAMGVFRSVARFNPRSIFYPPRSEIESEIELAFTEPASQLAYLKMLGGLPDKNPFKKTASIRYGEPTDSDTVATSSVSGLATAGIAAAAAGVVVLVAGIALLSRNRSGSEGDSEESSFPPAAYKKKSSAGSVAGETCAGTTWRSSVNEEELQELPLDDDKGAQRQHTSKLNVDY